MENNYEIMFDIEEDGSDEEKKVIDDLCSEIYSVFPFVQIEIFTASLWTDDQTVIRMVTFEVRWYHKGSKYDSEQLVFDILDKTQRDYIRDRIYKSILDSTVVHKEEANEQSRNRA